MSEPGRKFGPFLNVPCSDIRLAGWRCQRCRTCNGPANGFPRLHVRMRSHLGRRDPTLPGDLGFVDAAREEMPRGYASTATGRVARSSAG
jgi:hypothetical protein